MFDEIVAALPGKKVLDRTTMSSWEDASVINALNEIVKDRLGLCALWTSVCIVGPMQRDWSRGETYELTTGIARKFASACGLGIV